MTAILITLATVFISITLTMGICGLLWLVMFMFNY